MIVMSPLPFCSKPGRCSATLSVKEIAPRSTRSQTAQAVTTLVFEYSRPEGVFRSLRPRRIDARVADRLEQRQLAVPGHRDLRPRVARLGDVARDRLEQSLERLRVEVE